MGRPEELSGVAPSADQSRHSNSRRPATRLAPRIGSITEARERSDVSGRISRSTVSGGACGSSIAAKIDMYRAFRVIYRGYWFA